MNLQQLEWARADLRRRLHEYESIVPSCGTCKHCSTAFRCSRFDNAQPPQAWREGPVQCVHWEWDEIPF